MSNPNYSMYSLSLEEQSLINESLLGQSESYAKLFLLRVDDCVCRYKRLSTEEIEDLKQDAFIASFQNLKQLKNPQSFSVWLKMIVKLIVLKRRRKSISSRSLESLETEDKSQNELLHDKNKSGQPPFSFEVCVFLKFSVLSVVFGIFGNLRYVSLS